MRRLSFFVCAILACQLGIFPAASAAISPLPEQATIAFPGHGWGHGRGMGQWGAKGMADAGATYKQILTHYYSGVTLGSQPADQDIRVLVREGSTVVVSADSSFSISVSSGTSVGTSTSSYPYWRAWWDGSVYHVDRAASYAGPWAKVATSQYYVWFSPGSTPLELVSSSGSSVYYRGKIFARLVSGVMRGVNVLTMQQYLYGVVPRESPASWPAEELKAQAVAARSYATYRMDAQRAAGGWYDICVTTACQSYGGYATKSSPTATETVLESSASNAAVDATAGVVLLYDGKPILAEYSSSTGGYSAAGTVPYLQAVPDPTDSVSPHHDWTATLRTSDIEAKWPAIGRLIDLKVTQRDGNGEWGGRVVQISIVGTSSTVTVSGSSFAGAFPWPAMSNGFQSNWFTPVYYRGDLMGAPASITIPQGGEMVVPIQVKNSGTASWPIGGFVRLADASTRFYGSDWIYTTRPAAVAKNLSVPSATTVRPGQVALFDVPLHATSVAPGTYTERFNAIADGASTMMPAFNVAVEVVPGWNDDEPNLLTNGSFEPNAWGWKGSGLTAGDGSSTTTARDGRASFALSGGGNKRISQTISLAGGVRQLTFGGWNKTVGSTSSGGAVELTATSRYSDGSAQTWTLPFARASHAWTYAETAFTTSPARSITSLTVSAEYSNQTGTGYFDAIRLQDTPVVNGSFERGMLGWTTSGLSSGDGIVGNGADGYSALQIAGIQGTKAVSQALSLTGSHSERFTISAWTRADGTNSDGGSIAATLTLFNVDGTTQTSDLQFARSGHGWVYAEQEVTAGRPFHSARITLSMTDQTGTASFDDVRVARTWTHDASFEDGLSSWTGYGWGSGSGPTSAAPREGAEALRLISTGRTGVVQSIPFGGRAGARFVVSGWTRATSGTAGGSFIGYIIVLRNADGTSTGFQLPTYNRAHPWMYAERSIIAPKAFTRIDVYGAAYDQAGSSFFDGVRLRNA